MNYRGVATTFPFIEPTALRAGLDINDVTTWQLNPDGTSIRSDPNMLDLLPRNCTGSSAYFSYFYLNYSLKTIGAAKYYIEPKFPAPAYIAAQWADVEDMIADGIIVVGAGGNDGSTAAREGELDFNNHMKVGSKRNADGTISDYTGVIPSPYYYNRGSAPGSVTGAICVGAMESAPGRNNWAVSSGITRYNSQYRTNKTNFSKRGTRVDIWAAGRHIMSPYGEKSGGTNTNPDPRNPSYFNASISGTSMASPQVTGVCACLAEVFPNMKPSEMIEYLQYHSQKNGLDDFSISVTNDNFSDFGLNGAPNYILYMPETRPLKDSVYPMAKFKIRKTFGRVFPRPRIRRKG
jgi:subtilisin family serine protease